MTCLVSLCVWCCVMCKIIAVYIGLSRTGYPLQHARSHNASRFTLCTASECEVGGGGKHAAVHVLPLEPVLLHQFQLVLQHLLTLAAGRVRRRPRRWGWPSLPCHCFPHAWGLADVIPECDNRSSLDSSVLAHAFVHALWLCAERWHSCSVRPCCCTLSSAGLRCSAY